MALPSVRIRGIYATALSALLPGHGVDVVEASPIIAERLGLPTDGAAAVRLRDRPDHQGVRLEGTRAAARSLAQVFAGLLPDAVPRELRGPAAWEVELPGGSKRALDRARAAVWPTVDDHHHLKIVAGEAVDRAEQALAAGRGSPMELARELSERFIARALRPGRDVVIGHVKPDGRELQLRGRVDSLEGDRLRLTRRFRDGGTYDTLDAPKRGTDRGEIHDLVGSWVSIRRYLRADGALIGELYNVQTPTELYPTGLRYLDLEIDVARWPTGRVEVVDRRELADAVRGGYVSEALARRATEVAEGVCATLESGREIELADWR